MRGLGTVPAGGRPGGHGDWRVHNMGRGRRLRLIEGSAMIDDDGEGLARWNCVRCVIRRSFNESWSLRRVCGRDRRGTRSNGGFHLDIFIGSWGRSVLKEG